jgi:lactoylglutathione lyase
MTVNLTGVAHLGIRVFDLDRSRAFYEKLGFNFVVGPVGPEPVAILSHPGVVEINLILNGSEDGAPNILMDVDKKHAGYTHAALAVDDLDRTMAALDRNGIVLSDGPVDFPGGARAIFLRDPDGNAIELNQAAPEG